MSPLLAVLAVLAGLAYVVAVAAATLGLIYYGGLLAARRARRTR